LKKAETTVMMGEMSTAKQFDGFARKDLAKMERKMNFGQQKKLNDWIECG
jgi:hypothetical protein